MCVFVDPTTAGKAMKRTVDSSSGPVKKFKTEKSDDV